MLQLVNSYFTNALNFNNYHPDMQTQKYDGRIFGKRAKWAKLMDVQMRSVNFKPSEPISMRSFLQNFRSSCDCNGIYRAAGMWLFQHSLKDRTKAALVHRVSATKENVPDRKGKLTTYCQVVNYLPYPLSGSQLSPC